MQKDVPLKLRKEFSTQNARKKLLQWLMTSNLTEGFHEELVSILCKIFDGGTPEER